MNARPLATAIGSAVLGGLAVGYLTVGPMASADRATIADDPTAAIAVDDPDAPQTPAADPADPADEGTTHEERYREHLRAALAPLVADGTLTDAEVERIIDSLVAARPEVGPGRHGRPGHGPRVRVLREAMETAATTIGITVDQLREELRTNGTVAAVATAHGVEPQAVIDALVTAANTHIDARLAEGDITAEQAADLKAKVVERATTFVNDTPTRGPRGPKPTDD
jgi:hypothetical protein